MQGYLSQDILETHGEAELVVNDSTSPETDSSFAPSIGSRVRAAREALDLSQKTLAELAGLPAGQTVSEIEYGRRELRPSELVRLARCLHTDVDVLLGLTEPAAVGVLWRRKGGSANRTREAQLRERAEKYAQLERWCGEESPKHLSQFEFDFSSASADTTARLADEVRRIMDLGSIPAATLLPTLEEVYGVKVFWDHLTKETDGDCSAACVRGTFGAAVLLDASEVPWRRNFSLAHELFHLLTWDASAGATENGSWPGRLESLADHFAGNLLLPEASVSERFKARSRDGRVTYSELVRFARDFGVSTHALLIRLRDLRYIMPADVDRLRNDDTFRKVDQSSWAEIEEVSVPFSSRYVELAYAAYQQGTIGVSMLARYLEKPIADVALPDETVDDAGATAITVV